MGGMRVDKLDRKRYFVAQALNDLLAKRPIEQISVVDLCEEAGISRSTFYTYFEDIYSVGEWLWDQEFRPIFEALGDEYGYFECSRRLYVRLKELGPRYARVRPMRPVSGVDTYAGSNTFCALVHCLERALNRPLTQEEYERLEYSAHAEEAVTLKWFSSGMNIAPEKLAGYIVEMAPAFVKKALGE